MGAKGAKGTCKHCKRGDMSLPVKDTCGRCYSRISKGIDPVTNELPVGPNRQKSTKISPIDDQNSDGTLRPDTAILADDEVEIGGGDLHKNVEKAPKNVLQTAVQQKTKKNSLPEPLEAITLEFTSQRDRDLLSRVFSIATEERRTVENQILMVLEEYSSAHPSENH